MLAERSLRLLSAQPASRSLPLTFTQAASSVLIPTEPAQSFTADLLSLSLPDSQPSLYPPFCAQGGWVGG